MKLFRPPFLRVQFGLFLTQLGSRICHNHCAKLPINHGAAFLIQPGDKLNVWPSAKHLLAVGRLAQRVQQALAMPRTY